MQEYKLKNLPGLDNVEIEKKEKLLLPDGRSYQIGSHERSHTQGGLDIFAPAGTKIYSHFLKPGKKISKELLKNRSYKPRMSFADISNKYDTTKYRDTKEDKTGRYDKISKDTAGLMERKYLAHQETIFKAQEEYKASKNMDNDLEFAKKLGGLPQFKYGGRLPQYQTAGLTGSNTLYNPYLNLDNRPTQHPFTNRQLDYTRQTLYDLPEEARRVLIPNYDPNTVTRGDLNQIVDYTNFNSFEGINRPGGIEYGNQYNTGTPQRDYLDAYGDRGYDIVNYQGGDPLRLAMKEDYLKEIARGERIKPNTQFPNDPNRSNIPQTTDGRLFKNLSDSDFEADDFSMLNNRALKDGFYEQDFDQEQRNHIANYTGERKNGNLDPLPPKYGDFKTDPIAPSKPVEEVKYDDDYYDFKEENVRREEVGIDPMRYINGVQSAMLMSKLASTSVENPYYSYTPNKVAYTRFEPINTKQQERAYNIGTKSLKNSHLPESIKAANRVKMQANMARGVNEVDLTNAQGNLQNQNSNTQLLNQNNNGNLQARENANLQYMQERGRLNYLAQSQKQAYVENALDIWRSQAETTYNRQLMSALSDQYDIDKRGQVIYTPGTQKLQQDQLNNFSGGKGSSLEDKYLTREGLIQKYG